MKASKSRANDARYDQETEIYIGPPSKALRLDEDVAHSPFLASLAVAAPKYSHDLSSAALAKIAESCSVADVASDVRRYMGDKDLVQQLRKRLVNWTEVDSDGDEIARKSKRIRGNARADDAARAHGEMSSIAVTDDKVPYELNILAQPQYATLYYRRDGLLEQHYVQDSAPSVSERSSNIAKATDTDRELRPALSAGASNDTSKRAPFVLKVSIYSQHARGLWSKEKVKMELQRSAEGELDVLEDASEERSDVQDVEESKKNYTERGLYGNLQLSQEIDILSTDTLQDLRESIHCKMDTIPELQWRQENKKGMPLFADQRRATDSCFQIEDRLYSEKESMTSYASLIAEQLPDQTISNHSQHGSQIGSIPLCTGKLYWYIHQGNCEHLWGISSIRILDGEEEISYPRTTFCSYGSMIQPMSKFSRPKVPVMKQHLLDKCDFCRKRQGKKLIVGGSRVVIAATGVDGLKEDVVVSCDVCCDALIDSPSSSCDLASATSGQWTIIPSL